MGHAFRTAFIDMIVRFHRLKGKNLFISRYTDQGAECVAKPLSGGRRLEPLDEDAGRASRSYQLVAWKMAKVESAEPAADLVQRSSTSTPTTAMPYP